MLRRMGCVILLMILAACNLGSATEEPPPTEAAPEVTAGVDLNPVPQATATARLTIPTFVLTPLGPTPLPGAGPNTGAGLTLPGGTLQPGYCFVYTTYSGEDPNNLISLRSEPSTTAPQVARMPNNARVLLVPGSQEVEAETYHWLNIIYIDGTQNRVEGWTARDSFSRGGRRDPSIATLRPTGQQAPC